MWLFGPDVDEKRRKVRERRLGTGSIDLLIPEIKVRNFAKSKRYGNLNNRKDWKPQHRLELSKNSDYEILAQYNAEMRGFAEYDKLATNFYKGLGLLYYIAEKSLGKTLAKNTRPLQRRYTAITTVAMTSV